MAGENDVALKGLLGEKEIRQISNDMFCKNKAADRERWLLGFAAPVCQVVDISLGYMYSDSFYLSRFTDLEENRQIFRERWGAENADELRELIDRAIARPAAHYLDRIFLVMRDYAPSRYYDIIRRVIPINEFIEKNVKFLAGIFDDMSMWEIKIPDSTVYAFDLARAANLAIQGYWLRYIDKMESALLLEKIARQASRYYEKWEDYVSAAVLGTQLWRVCSRVGGVGDDVYKAARILLKSPESAYNSFPLKIDKGVTSSKAAYSPEFLEKRGAALQEAVYTSKELYAADGRDFYDRLLLCVNPDRLGKDPDPMSEKFFLESQEEMFPDAHAEDLETWLCAFSAPIAGENGTPVNQLIRYVGQKRTAIVKKLKKQWRITNGDELMQEAQYIFSDGAVKHNDIILLQIANSEPEEWAERIARYTPIKTSQRNNLKRLRDVKRSLGYYNFPMPTVTTLAFDMTQVAFLALAGYGVGYIERPEAVDLLKKAAWCANRYYKSWREFFGGCIMGRAIWKWSICKYKDASSSAALKKARVAVKSDRSPCLRFNFDQFVLLCEEPENVFSPYPYKDNGVMETAEDMQIVK